MIHEDVRTGEVVGDKVDEVVIKVVEAVELVVIGTVVGKQYGGYG